VCLISRQDPEMLPRRRGWIQININRRPLVLTQAVAWLVGVGKEGETGSRGEM